MFQNLNVFRIAQTMAAHSGAQQAVISANIANADTPGYKAKTLAPFSSLVTAPDGSVGARATRGKHLNGQMSGTSPRAIADTSASASPNENNVAIEMEMLKAVEAKRSHDRALAIYKHSLDILRMSLGRG